MIGLIFRLFFFVALAVCNFVQHITYEKHGKIKTWQMYNHLHIKKGKRALA